MQSLSILLFYLFVDVGELILRKVIVTNELAPDGDGGTGLRRGINRKELRLLALLADSIEYPLLDWVPVKSTPEEEYLMECGLMTRTDCIVNRNIYYDFIFGAHLRLLEEKDIAEPGQWSLASSGLASRQYAYSVRPWEYRGISVDEALMAPTLNIKLAQCIPVPDQDVPFEDILEFKERRRDELLALRYNIDDVYQAILASPDKSLGEVSQIERFNNALIDQVEVSKEASISLGVCDLSASFNISSGIAAFIASLPLGVMSAAVIGAGTGASVELAKSIDFRSNMQSTSPLQYVSSFHNEVFR